MWIDNWDAEDDGNNIDHIKRKKILYITRRKSFVIPLKNMKYLEGKYVLRVMYIHTHFNGAMLKVNDDIYSKREGTNILIKQGESHFSSYG